MNESFWRYLIHQWVGFWGRRQSIPIINFLEGKIFAHGKKFTVSILGCTYINLPPNVYGIIVHPDGTNHRITGGLSDFPSGKYKLQYVQKNGRIGETSLVSEMTADGEKIALVILIRYQIIDPVTALEIENPVETLFATLEADTMQYIRTRNHNEIADAKDSLDGGRLLQFLRGRHNNRHQISKAFMLTGAEIKVFQGDPTFISLRQDALINERKTQNDKLDLSYAQEIERIKAEYKAVTDKWAADKRAELDTLNTRHRSQIDTIIANHHAEIETIGAKNKAAMLDVLREVNLIDEQRKRDQMWLELTSQLSITHI
ncbi:hypothetical protein GW781_11795 [bacterium]|nr:hypothetical protein [bacterium]NCT21823.1 hypothetical protein [bacterium]OIO83607.1 MAG: hypothetical protein AUK01_12045 [Anaerolineae bacterium CG2_30_57_67]